MRRLDEDQDSLPDWSSVRTKQSLSSSETHITGKEKREVSALYRECKKLEKQLQAVKDRGEGVTHVRSVLKSKYTTLLKCEPLFSAQNDLSNRLWRMVFYSQLEELKKLKKEGDMSDLLFSFIEESKVFYVDVLDTLVAQKDKNNWEYLLDDRGKPLSVNTALIRLISCCQNHLGDLSRYREVYDDDECKNWDSAREWYTAAHRSNPFSGNPHNQLAVLAHYSGDMLETVYRYYRSLAAREPFLATRENLINFFEKIRRTSALRTQSSRTQPEQRAWHVAASPTCSTSDFTSCFLSIHGMLFTRTNLECFEMTLDHVASMFSTLLTRPDATEEYLLRLMAMNIFTVHNASYRPEGYRPTASDEQQRQILKAKALELTFTFWALMMDTNVQAAHAALCVFITWIASDDEVLPVILNSVPEAELFSRFCRLTSTLMQYAGGSQPTQEMLFEEIYLHGFICLDQWGAFDTKLRSACTSLQSASSKRLQLLQPFTRHAVAHNLITQKGSILTPSKELVEVPSFDLTAQPVKGVKGAAGLGLARGKGKSSKSGHKSPSGKGRGWKGKGGKGHKEERRKEESDEERTAAVQESDERNLEAGISNLLMQQQQGTQHASQGIDLLKMIDTGMSQITLSQAKDMLPVGFMQSQTQCDDISLSWGPIPGFTHSQKQPLNQGYRYPSPSTDLYSSLNAASTQPHHSPAPQRQQPTWAPWNPQQPHSTVYYQ